jgi:putative membrane protein
MSHGFLGYHATFMLDFVICALVLIVPVLGTSIYLVKVRRAFVWHRRLQIFLAVVLLLAVTAFEVDVQLIHGGWQSIVREARPEISAEGLASIRRVLLIHLLFAISTPCLWATTLGLALANFGNPPAPSRHSRWHKRLGWISATDLTLTSVTGLWFYYSAFISR